MTMTLQEISDRLEIQELFVDYTQAIDCRNWDGVDDVFTADAHIDFQEIAEGDLRREGLAHPPDVKLRQPDRSFRRPPGVGRRPGEP